MKVFSIRDAKAEVYHNPWFAKTHAEAERSFASLVRDGKSQVSQFPEDFDLYYVGDFDDQKGVIHSLDTPQHMHKAIQFKASI